MICRACDRRDVVVGDDCVVCHFLRSEEGEFDAIVHSMFVSNPESAGYAIQDQIDRLISFLPYAEAYKSSHRKELAFFARKSIARAYEYIVIDVE